MAEQFLTVYLYEEKENCIVHSSSSSPIVHLMHYLSLYSIVVGRVDPQLDREEKI